MHLHIGHTVFGAGNIGDDLVLAGFLEGTAAARPGLKLTCATPFDIASQRRRFPKIEWWQDTDASRRSLIAACDAWVGLGSSILQPIDDSWLLPDQLRQIEDCRRFNKPVFFAGNSAGYRTDSDRAEVRALLDAATHIWTRDAMSTISLKRMGFDRVTTGADFAHLALRKFSFPAPPEQTAFVCNFERDSDYSIALLTDLIDAVTPPDAAWLVQEVRRLAGSERDIHDRLPPEIKRRLALWQPDYASAADVAELLGSWPGFDRLFTSRFHATIIGAWQGSRVVVFEREPRLRGLAADLGIISLPVMPDRNALMDAFDRARPVERSVLDLAVKRADNACTELLEAAAAAAPRLNIPDVKPMHATTTPVIESHTLDGITHVDAAALGHGLTHGGIFVVRGCLQAIGALAPLREMILNTLEEVAGSEARARAETEGLSQLHTFVPIAALMRMNPLMKQRARLLAPPIVTNLAAYLPELGPDVHFEDTPNVRIFIPHNDSTRFAEELAGYVRQRGSGGELTLHPPHQDSRHYHPLGAINVWCAIEDVVEENGMSVFPKFYGHHLPFTQADGGIRPDQYLGPPVTMDLAPGDAWIFETIHMHGSTINQTDKTRFVISFRITGDAPQFRDKPWYSYVRPSDCAPGSLPPNPIDYSQTPPDRGPVTIDTRDAAPPPIAASTQPNGDIAIDGTQLGEGDIRAVSDQLCVARIEGHAVAFARRCPHEGADLAGGTIRDGRIMCVWHGLRMDPADGSTGCRAIPALRIFPSQEQAGTITIASGPETIPAAHTPVDPFADAVAHFHRAADQYHTALSAYRQFGGMVALRAVDDARMAAAHVLLALPGSVVRDRLREPALLLVRAVLGSDVRSGPRPPAEDTTFVECWRRLGRSTEEDLNFSYGLALLIMSRNGFELLGLSPLDRKLGWTEQLWLRRLFETVPRGSLIANTDLPTDMLPPAIQEIRAHFFALDAGERNELLRTRGAQSRGQGSGQDGVQGSVSDLSALQEQVQMLTDHLREANADREVCHRDIHTLTGHLKEANAARDAIYRSTAFKVMSKLSRLTGRASS